VSVPIIADSSIEADETFFLNLTTPKGGVIGDTQAVITIVNDD
jgi:chitinase